MNVSGVQYRLLDGFDDPSISPEAWNALLSRGSTDEIFLTWHYQKAWWDAFGRGTLLLAVAESQGELRMIAPCFAEAGMVYFVGSGGSDYLDFIGKTGSSQLLLNLMRFVIDQVEGFCGFQLFHVPVTSRTTKLIGSVSKDLQLRLALDSEWPCPLMSLSDRSVLAAAVRKKSLLRHEAYFRRNGVMQIDHLKEFSQIEPFLDRFFNQHVERCRMTTYESLFSKPEQRFFYRHLAEIASSTGWLRFTCVQWNGRPIAFHYGFNYKGSFLWYKPSFDPALARRSPGEVLIKYLLLNAKEECMGIFDFGLGDEEFKKRFSTGSRSVRSWTLSPPSIFQRK